MTVRKSKKLLSILMESPLYLTLTLSERRSLLAGIAESYPFIMADEDDTAESGYESNWSVAASEK